MCQAMCEPLELILIAKQFDCQISSEILAWDVNWFNWLQRAKYMSFSVDKSLKQCSNKQHRKLEQLKKS